MSEPNEVYIAVGRRKTASARVRLIPGTGKVTVNKRAFEDYFPTEAMRGFAVQPLVITGKQAIQTKLLADLLDSILFDTEGAPLKKAILESGIADDLYSNSGFDTETPQVVFTVGATGLNQNDIPKLRKIVIDTLRDFAMKGPTALQLKTAFRQLKIEKLEIDGAFLYNLIDDVFDGWIHDDDPLAMLNSAKALDALENMLHANPRLLPDFVRQTIIENNHAVDLQFIPDLKLGARNIKEKEKRLRTLKTGMSKEQRQTIAKQQKQLLERQTTPDSPEALAALPTLSRKDISPLPLAFHPERLTSSEQRHPPAAQRLQTAEKTPRLTDHCPVFVFFPVRFFP